MEISVLDVLPARSLSYDGDEVLLLALGDLQLDPVVRGKSRVADVDRIRRVVEWGISHGAYFLGMGDYADALSTSNRDAWEAARLYDSARDAMEAAADKTLDELLELFAGTAGRWAGLLSGHHYFRFSDGSTTDTRLAAALGARHLGDSAIVHLRFPADGHKRAPVAKVWAAHGNGSGATAGAALSKVERAGRAIAPRCDVFLMGHYHQAQFAKRQYIDTWGGEKGGVPRMMARDIALACTGSFMRGYTEGSRRGGVAAGSYVEKALLAPSAMGAVVVSVRPRVSSHGYTRIDLDGFTL